MDIGINMSEGNILEIDFYSRKGILIIISLFAINLLLFCLMLSGIFSGNLSTTLTPIGCMILQMFIIWIIQYDPNTVRIRKIGINAKK